MSIDLTLEKIGLDSKEKKVYLALLELGQGTVKDIAQLSALKRPHVYNILEDLEKRQLVSRSPEAKVVKYNAEHPRQLLEELENTRNSLINVLPELTTIFGKHIGKPRIRLLEGIEGIRKAYEEALKSNALDMCGSLKDVKPVLATIINQVAQKTKRKPQAHIRDIITQDEEGFDYARKARKKNHEVHFLPKDLNFFIDFAIYENSVVIFSLRENIFALIIESEDIANSLRSLYELAWRQSTEDHDQ